MFSSGRSGFFACVCLVAAMFAAGCAGKQVAGQQAVPEPTVGEPTVAEIRSDEEPVAEEPAATKVKLDTPRDTLRSMLQAGVKGDADSFMKCLIMTEAEEPAARALCNLLSAAYGFEQTLVETFGADALEVGRLSGSTPVRLNEIEDMEFSIDGDRAVGRHDRWAEMLLKRVGEDWLIDFTKAVSKSGEDIEAFLAMAEKAAQAYKEMAAEATKEGATVESVNEALQLKMDELGM